jgi:hypothetical protein
VPICSNLTDDNGKKIFSRTSLETNKLICTGNSNYSVRAPDYEVGFVYDATIALVKAIVDYSKEYYSTGNDFIIPDIISGRSLKDFMTKNFKVSGSLTRGTIQFSSGIPERNNYGSGDQTFRVRYPVVTFNDVNGSISGFQMSRVGTWYSESGYISCSTDPAIGLSSTICTYGRI